MSTTAMHLAPEALARAEAMRVLLTEAEEEVRSGARKRARAIKVGLALSPRCDVTGIEGRLVAVSTTGAIITVRDAATRETVDVPAADIQDWERL